MAKGLKCVINPEGFRKGEHGHDATPMGKKQEVCHKLDVVLEGVKRF
jgi:hypothetical protein